MVIVSTTDNLNTHEARYSKHMRCGKKKANFLHLDGYLRTLKFIDNS